jgi:hypothetical protein
MGDSLTKYWVYFTREAAEHLSEHTGGIIGEYIQHEKMLVCRSFNPEPYFLHVVAEPVEKEHFPELEFLIPYQFVLTILTVGQKHKNLGFQATRENKSANSDDV